MPENILSSVNNCRFWISRLKMWHWNQGYQEAILIHKTEMITQVVYTTQVYKDKINVDTCSYFDDFENKSRLIQLQN